jgi:formylglycine-generating enzyme required for sulfatase activity
MMRVIATTTTVFGLCVLRPALFATRTDGWEIHSACPEESRPTPAMRAREPVSKNKPGLGSLVVPVSLLGRTVAQPTRFNGPMPLIQHREARTTQYYTEILDNRTPLDMVLIQGGSFFMGSPEDEPERSKSEGPQHKVTVPPFFMARYPITQAQWRVVAALPKGDRDLNPDPSHFKGDQHPVERVSWHDATEFCCRLAAQTSRPYRLPSEAEWEYACRAGTTTPFYFGRTITPELANYDGRSTYNDGPKGENRKETTPVDQFGIANAFGLCDLQGNVWEWCQDHWHDNYTGAPVDGTAWVDPEALEDASRVLRGGSWVNNPRHCRSAARHDLGAGVRFSFFGFRVVCVAPRTL